MLTMEEKRARAAEAVAILEERYPDAECAALRGRPVAAARDGAAFRAVQG